MEPRWLVVAAVLLNAAFHGVEDLNWCYSLCSTVIQLIKLPFPIIRQILRNS